MKYVTLQGKEGWEEPYDILFLCVKKQELTAQKRYELRGEDRKIWNLALRILWMIPKPPNKIILEEKRHFWRETDDNEDMDENFVQNEFIWIIQIKINYIYLSWHEPSDSYEYMYHRTWVAIDIFTLYLSLIWSKEECKKR